MPDKGTKEGSLWASQRANVDLREYGANMTAEIKHLPGTRLSPDVVLHRTLGKVERIKAVIVLIQWDDETWDTDWSQMKASEFAMASVIMGQEAVKTVYGEPDGRIVEKPTA